MAADERTTMTARFKPPIVPAAFFGIVLGLSGLGSARRMSSAAGGGREAPPKSFHLAEQFGGAAAGF
jgi:hypothetical protein